MFTKRIHAESGYSPRPARQRAVALGYDPQRDAAPRVLAAGQGHIAEQILAIARENQIVIREDPLLAEALSTLDVGEMIPPDLYAIVAEVLAYVYRVRGRKLGE